MKDREELLTKNAAKRKRYPGARVVVEIAIHGLAPAAAAAAAGEGI